MFWLIGHQTLSQHYEARAQTVHQAPLHLQGGQQYISQYAGQQPNIFHKIWVFSPPIHISQHKNSMSSILSLHFVSYYILSDEFN